MYKHVYVNIYILKSVEPFTISLDFIYLFYFIEQYTIQMSNILLKSYILIYKIETTVYYPPVFCVFFSYF
jgi:hypothetical protein